MISVDRTILQAQANPPARRINAFDNTTGMPFWQRSFYDRIIRDDEELHDIEKYIEANPRRLREE